MNSAMPMVPKADRERERERVRERERDRDERDWERLNENSKRNRGRRMIQNVYKVCMRMKSLTVHLGK